MKNYIEALAETYDIPYYLIVGLVCEEKQKRVVLKGDFLNKLKQDLEAYIEEYENLKGIKTKDIELYNRITIAKKLLGDGSGRLLTSKDVLIILGIEGVESNFKDTTDQELDIEEIMQNIKANNHGEVVKLNTLDKKDYAKIKRKSVSMGIYVSDIFNMYGMKCNGITLERLSKLYLKEIPYIDEMLTRKHELIEESGISIENGNCKEEVMEINIKVCKQVYEEFKEKIYELSENGNLNVD